LLNVWKLLKGRATGPTSRRVRFSEPTRVTRPTNPRLLANPSHRHKRLLIYRRCRYFLIFPLLTYCFPRYIFFAQDGRQKGGVPEAEVVQNRQFITTPISYLRYGHMYSTACYLTAVYKPQLSRSVLITTLFCVVFSARG